MWIKTYMLTSSQIKEFSKSLKINESVVVREYIQTLFLKELYDEKYSQNIFFKGGTAIRLLFNGTRFSEDLDFTINADEVDFDDFINKLFKKLEKEYGFSFKKRKTIAGIKYLLTVDLKSIDYKVFVNLDFSFREKVMMPSKSIISTNYPIIFTSFINHLSGEEIVAEKVRAIITRDKGRDIYDLWFLLNKNILVNNELVKDKLKYYGISEFKKEKLIEKINKFSKEKFILDLRPFIPINEREKLADFFNYTVSYLQNKLGK